MPGFDPAAHRAEQRRGEPRQQGAGDLASTLAGWRKTEQAATPGPWRAAVAPNGGPLVETTWLMPEGYVGAGMTIRTAYLLGTAGKAEEETANAEFIATARTAFPLLLAALEAVLKAVDRLDSERGDYGHLVNRHEVARAFREAITRELTKETGDGG